MENRASLAALFPYFMIFVAAVAVAGAVVFYRGKDAVIKRKWWPSYCMLMGGSFVAFTALSVLQTPGPNAWPSFIMMVLVLAVITLFNMKKTKFCDQCGAVVHARWETPEFCPKCRAKLPN
jgi:hypothetical protein